MSESGTQQELLALLAQQSEGVASFDEMAALARQIGAEKGFAPHVVEALVQFLESQSRQMEAATTAAAPATSPDGTTSAGTSPSSSENSFPESSSPESSPAESPLPGNPPPAKPAPNWTPPRLRVEWGENIAIGRQVCPQFFLTSPSDFLGEPRVELSIDQRLDHEESSCRPQLLKEDDNEWTFDVPFAMTTGGGDCRPGRYRIEVRAAFPHVGGDCPWYYCCTIRLTVGDASGADGPTLEIEGDGQSIVNLHGGDLKRFSTVRLKGGDRAVVNLQDLSRGSASGAAELTPSEIDEAIFEYELRVDDRRRRLRPIVTTTRPATYETPGRLSLLPSDGRRIQLLSRRKVTLGRTRTNEIRTYFLPRDKENDARTVGISGVHAALQLTEDGLRVCDEGSRNGVALTGQKVDVERLLTEADADEDLRFQLASELKKHSLHLELRLFGRSDSAASTELDAVYCDSLRLPRRPKLWRLAASSRIDALRLQRVNNLPEEEYVVVFCQAVIGSAGDVAIRIAQPSVEHRHARVLAIGDSFWLENIGPARSVRLGDRPLEKRELVPLQEGAAIGIGDVTIAVEPFQQLHL